MLSLSTGRSRTGVLGVKESRQPVGRLFEAGEEEEGMALGGGTAEHWDNAAAKSYVPSHA